MAAHGQDDPDVTRVANTRATGFASSSAAGSDAGGRMANANLPVGTVLAGRYEIIELLGEGGMGAVYKATDHQLDRVIALKTIRQELARDTEMLARFKQELILARQITHRNVIRIYDLGEDAGSKFITMEFADGVTLRSLISERGKIPPGEAVEIARQICLALEAAHAEGVIHRDLKPQNIMRNQQGRVVVMDFGLARTLSSTMTQTGALVGTMEYMSPEQALGKNLDARSDLFAIGLILHELLTGRTPYQADTAIASLIKRSQEAAASASDVDASVPRDLSRIVSKCLERDCSRRYQSAGEILKDLDAWAAGGTVSAIASRRPALDRKRMYAVGAGVLLVALVAGFGLRQHFVSSTNSSQHPSKEVSASAISLAILPFRNGSGEGSLNWIGSSVAEMLTTEVGESQHLRTIAPYRMHQVLSDLRIAPDNLLDPAMLRRVAEFSSADTVIWGQYVRLGEKIRFDLTLHNLKTDHQVSLTGEAANESDIPAAVHRIADAVRQNLSISPDVIKELQSSSFSPRSASSSALRDYNQGEEFLHSGKYLEALKSFQAATKEDGSFALAFSDLAQCYAQLGFDGDAEQSSRKAVELSRQSPQAEKYLIDAQHAAILKDTGKAIAAYENLAASRPENNDIQYALAGLYLDQGEIDKARVQLQKILHSDPKNVRALWRSGVAEIQANDPQAALESLTRGLTLADQLDNQEQKSLMLQAIGISYRLMNKPDAALRSYQDAMEINRRLGLKRNLAGNLIETAQVDNMLGKPDAAMSSYTQALRIQREIGIKKEVGDTLLDMGVLLADRGQHEKALQSYKEALQIQRDSGDSKYEALCLNNIGLVYLAKGSADDALTYMQQALEIRRKLNVPADIAETMGSLGEAYTAMGRYDQALASFMDALGLYRKAGDIQNAAAVYNQMGVVFLYQARFGAAINSMQDAVKSLRDAGQHNRDLAEFMADLASGLAQAGRGNESAALLEEPLALSRALKNSALETTVLNAQGDVRFYGGDMKGARASYSQAFHAAAQSTEKGSALTSKLNLAKVSIAEGHPQSAARDLRAISEQAAAAGLQYLSLDSAVTLGEALLADKNYDQSRTQLEGALTKSERLGLRAQTARIHYLIANAMAGNPEAEAHYKQSVALLDDLRKEDGATHLLDRSDLRSMYAEATHRSSTGATLAHN
jgi:serine/threonine protein kinase/lipopolysaccharide biosynthesis regulator YciM